jgi:RimJ/RimL family protein N-acetyltransferase
MVEGPSLEATRQFVRSNIERAVPQYLAITGKRVIGWCDVAPLRPEGFRHVGRLGMGVEKRYRRRGIGLRLIERTIQAAVEQGIERIELEVLASNIPAIRLYEKVGFVVEGVKKKMRKLDGEYDDLVGMVLFVQMTAGEG